jgi:hypothetical protein
MYHQELQRVGEGLECANKVIRFLEKVLQHRFLVPKPVRGNFEGFPRVLFVPPRRSEVLRLLALSYTLHANIEIYRTFEVPLDYCLPYLRRDRSGRTEALRPYPIRESI